jgi:hypothetical protein
MTRVAYGARLHVRRGGSPAGPDSRIVREAAYQEAEDAFRLKLGLAAVMDLPGTRVDIEVWLW